MTLYKTSLVGNMRDGRIGFNQLTINDEMILYMTLQSIVDLKRLGLFYWPTLGIRVKKVSLRVGCKDVVYHDSSISFWISFPKNIQQVWNKYDV